MFILTKFVSKENRLQVNWSMNVNFIGELNIDYTGIHLQGVQQVIKYLRIFFT